MQSFRLLEISMGKIFFCSKKKKTAFRVEFKENDVEESDECEIL
jgi:hypothetical protein